jgi:hypothetical protein
MFKAGMARVWVSSLALACACLAQTREMTPSEARTAAESDLRGDLGPRPDPGPASGGSQPAPANTDDATLVLVPIPPAPRDSSDGGTVTVSSLRHKLSKKSQKGFLRASRLSRSGDFPGAARELEKVLAGDPDFAEARVNLGVQYWHLGRLRDAEAELLRGLQLNPYSTVAHSNLSAVQIGLGDLAEAERNARRALAISVLNDRARYLLGVILTQTPETKSEGLRELEFAARTMPAARILLDSLRGR